MNGFWYVLINSLVAKEFSSTVKYYLKQKTNMAKTSFQIMVTKTYLGGGELV